MRRLAARSGTSFPGEIVGDELAERLREIAADPGVDTFLEVGSATGDGSTRALVAGAERNPRSPRLFCLEAVRERFVELEARYAAKRFVHAYNASSVAPDAYASVDEVRAFHGALQTALNAFPLDEVLGWRRAELEYLRTAGIPVDGIEAIRRDHGVDRFDAVLLDGSEFTARSELELVHGALWLALDDVNSFKNHGNCVRLVADPAYELVAANPRLRHGYAVFRRASA